MIKFECPHCQNAIKVSESASGRQGTCKNCGKKITVPQQVTLANNPPENIKPPTFKKTRIILGGISVLIFITWAFASEIHFFSINQIDKHRKWKVPPAQADPAEQSVPEDDSEKTQKQELAQRLEIVSELTARAPKIVAPDDFYPFKGNEEYEAYYEFDDRLWVPIGYSKYHGTTLGRTLMYSNGDKNERLVLRLDDYVPDPQKEPYDVVFYLSLQRKVNGKWVDDGLQETRFRDGEKKIHSFRLGEFDGLTKLYYANGKKRAFIEYENGKQNGRAQGWYMSGKKYYDCLYENDKEVSGTYWDEAGKERPQ